METRSGKCCLCGSAARDELNFGEFKYIENIKVHYYCLLLASTIVQQGKDEEGILGFLYKDIIAEIERSKSRFCVYCSKPGASVYCSSKGCKVIFHLPCGTKHGSGHQFHGAFLSTCHVHCPQQKFHTPSETQCCPICYDSIDYNKNIKKVLWAPCCKKNAYFHKTCIQRMALSAGYFFKCPVCNDKDKFQQTMRNFGVFIPDQDAAWETEPNAFQELYYRHNECNARLCTCLKGRNYCSTGMWYILLCNSCGSQGIHVACTVLKRKRPWTCPDCLPTRKSPMNNFQKHIADPTSTTEALPGCSNSLVATEKRKYSPKDHFSGDSACEQLKENCDSRIASARASEVIELDDSDDDVIIIDDNKREDEPSLKCLIMQDGSVLHVKNIAIKQEQEFSVQGDLHIETPTYEQPESPGLGLKITNVRSLSNSDFSDQESSDDDCDDDISDHESLEDHEISHDGHDLSMNSPINSSEGTYSLKQVLYTAAYSSYRFNREVQGFSRTNQLNDSNAEGNINDNSSESDVIIID